MRFDRDIVCLFIKLTGENYCKIYVFSSDNLVMKLQEVRKKPLFNFDEERIYFTALESEL